jgi:hypothetical protein
MSRQDASKRGEGKLEPLMALVRLLAQISVRNFLSRESQRGGEGDDVGNKAKRERSGDRTAIHRDGSRGNLPCDVQDGEELDKG